MKIRCTLLAACMLCLGMAACGDSSLLTPEGPRFDGGSTIGSGNRTETTPTPTSTMDTTLVLPAERGGYGIGSGN